MPEKGEKLQRKICKKGDSKMSKIVFFDIDGTLLNHKKELPSATAESIKKLKQNGVYVAIATGRAPFMFEELREELGIESFISFNGQYVVFENEVIYENSLNQSQIEKIIPHSKENKHPLVFMNETTMKANVGRHSYIEQSLGSLNFKHPEEDASFYMGRKIYQSLLFCTEKEEKQYHEQYENFKFIRWHPYSVDILPSGGSKAEGIKKMIAKLGFRLEDVYAFGDGLNDIEMIQTVGNGVAMGNAVAELKEHAKLITKDVDANGITYGLKELQLI